MQLAIMIEGQNGLNWTRWQRLAQAVEDLGFSGLFRSDHYTNANPPDLDSLELWVSLTWLASHTRRIEFGPLVSPVSFRHPPMTARMAAAVDDLSQGRLVLGLGAGWQEREHEHYSHDLLPVPERFARFEEGLEIITALLKQDTPLDFAGQYYQLKEAVLLPRPQRPGGPPILIGGNGPQRTLPLVARYADEWNAVYLPIPELKARNELLDQLLAEQGRQPAEVRRSLMTGCVFAADQASLERAVQQRSEGRLTAAELRQRGLVVGTAPQVVEQLKAIEASGVRRVMLQWLDLDDIAGLERLAIGVLAQL